MTFGRSHLIEKFILNPDSVCVIPQVLFCDGFGAYRNSYRSLTAVHCTPANLPLEERRKLYNNRLLTIGPFGSKLEDLIDAIKPAAQELDHGLDMNLHLSPGFSIKAYVCAFQFLHTSDLPQQNDSSGTMRQNANYGCRSCLINKNSRDDLSFNIVMQGRYQFEMERARAAVNKLPKGRKLKLLARLGLAPKVSPWTRISRAINQFEVFAIDSCHSEGSGIEGLIDHMIKDWLLTQTLGRFSYKNSV
ncbi:hypothetical protein EDC01DRAFT_616999 [Geopyxis carbonaria]|nr:hypothetical protein EDC01DRAFT_616999 [Geopyxis carbonaria]